MDKVKATAKRNRTEPGDLLTIEQFASILGRTPAAIRQAKSRGQLPPAARILGRPMWRRAVVEQWIEAQFRAAGSAH